MAGGFEPDPMRLGFVTFEGMDYDRAIRFAGERRFDAIELQMTYLTAGQPTLGRVFLDERRDEVRGLLGETGLDLVVHLPHTMDIGAAAPRIREASVGETRACLETAAAIGAEACVIHPQSSARSRGWRASDVRSFILESIRQLDGIADDLDVRLCMENLRRGVFTIDEFDRFFEETEAQMTLDVGHARIAGLDEASIASFVERHRDRIGHVHASDNKGYVAGFDGAIGDDHAPTGVGDLDFGTALGPLTDAWDGTVSLEIHTQSLEYVGLAKEHFERAMAGT